ncbi:MAG: hypothetical protein JO264_01275 [Acidisphaera sp.]|nr:hypothetical protein [Acidisphaera sp.]
MSDQPETYLRRLDTKVDELKADMVEVKERLGLIEAQYSSLSRRVDRMAGDVAQIKVRLDLAEAE